MRAIDLALKDVRQVLRDKRSLVFLLVMPVIFTFFFGFAFSKQDKQADPRLPVGILNRDADGALSVALVSLLDGSESARPVLLSEEDAAQVDAQVVKGELAAGLVIPAGFSAQTLSGGSPQMELVINEESNDGQTARRALQTGIIRAMGIAQAAHFSLQSYEAQAGPQDEPARAAYLDDAVQRALKEWQGASLGITTASAADPRVKTDPLALNPYNQFSPGMIVQFAFFGLLQAAMVLVVERRTRAMARLLTTPMRRAELIGGHALGMFLIFFVQQLILVVFGQLVLKVDYFRQPLATLLVVTSLALWVSATGLLISALVQKEEQVVLAAMIGMFVFSALGGAWFSLEMVGGAFAAIGHLTPAAWAIDGFQNIILRGQGLASVLLPAGIVLAYAAAFFGLAIWKFRVE